MVEESSKKFSWCKEALYHTGIRKFRGKVKKIRKKVAFGLTLTCSICYNYTVTMSKRLNNE